ncbi:MAG TPA: M48 family metalloprotease [Thermoanaerobaculia bacterium]|nr:M48 family metalloprotease [Thermoanaerobaculia bacterium]
MDRNRIRRHGTAAGLLALALAAGACSTNPATGQRQLAMMGQGQEIEMGRQADQEISATMGLYPDDEVQAYVSRLGKALAAKSERPDLPWSFRVLDDPIVNAFALPGGFIYVTRGLMTHLTSEAELASVLGHEIGHVTGRHTVERLSKAQLASIGLAVGMILQPELRNYGDLAQAGLGLLFLKYSRDDEREADSLGLRYLNSGDYDPQEMVEVFDVLRRVSAQQKQGRVPGWMATHPTPENRIERISSEVAKLPASGDRVVARERYLQAVDGVVFGDNPREGYFRGNTFIHPELGFQLRFPDGWKPSNQKQAVGAISPREDAVVVLTLSGRNSPEQAAREFFGQQGVQQGPALRASLGGLPAVANVFGVARQQGPSLQGIAAFVELGGKVYQLLGYTTQARWNGYDSVLSGAIGSFERVTDRRALDVQPKRVDVVTLPSAMTLEEFAKRYPSTVDLQTLAIINHLEGNERIPAGTEVKRVVGGELPA